MAAFDIDGARKAGYSDAEIADHLASQSNFDAVAARKAGYGDSDIISHLATPTGPKPAAAGGVSRETSTDPGRAARAAAQTEADRKTYDPTVGMNSTEKVLAGVGKAFSDTGRGIGQLVGKGLDAVSTPQKKLSDLVTGGQGTTLSQRLGLPQDADIAETRRLDTSLMNTGAGMAGNIGGNVLMALAPGGALKGAATLARTAGAARAAGALEGAGAAALAPTTLRGAATLGAGLGAVQPVTNNLERLQNIGLGGAAGAGGQAAVNSLARVVRPNTSAAVRGLMDEGVTPTPGQILGGGFKRAEEGLTSVPIIGDAIKSAQTRAVTDLNTAAFNRALAPVGEKLPKGLGGREAVDYVGETLGKKYDALLPNLTTQADGQFINEMQSLRNMMGSGSIDPAKAAQFEALLNNQVFAKFQPGAAGAPTLTGQTMKQIETDLGQLSSKFQRSLDPDQQMVGDALQEVQASLRSAVMRNNPQVAPELQRINEGWANFKRVQRAASSVAAEGGQFSPAQLQAAVKATDRSKDKGAFARGDALMQDLAEPAKAVLGPKVPDSGTPFRMLTTLGAGGAAGGLIGPGTAAAILAGPALYSRAGQNALATVLARRGAAAEPAANALRRLAPYTTAPAIGLSEQ